MILQLAPGPRHRRRPIARVPQLALITVLASSLLLGAPALAAAPQEAAPARIAALVASPNPDDKELADNLTEVLVAALAAQDPTGATGIVGQEEFRAQLGKEDRGIIACLGEPSCLTRVGRVLKVDLVLVAQVSRSVGDEYLVNANAIEVQTGKVRRTLLRRPRGQKALIAAVRALAGTLLRPPTAALRIETNVEADVYVDGRLVGRGRLMDLRELRAGSHQVRAQAPGKARFEATVELAPEEQRTLGITLVAEVKPGRPFYKTWWFWSTVGAAVAGGAAAGIVLGTRAPTLPDAVGTITVSPVGLR